LTGRPSATHPGPSALKEGLQAAFIGDWRPAGSWGTAWEADGPVGESARRSGNALAPALARCLRGGRTFCLRTMLAYHWLMVCHLSAHPSCATGLKAACASTACSELQACEHRRVTTIEPRPSKAWLRRSCPTVVRLSAGWYAGHDVAADRPRASVLSTGLVGWHGQGDSEEEA
jgi:hypothetical protein